MSYSGAGVLPYTTDSHGKVSYLFSQEAHGRDKGTYADFGGKRDHGETSKTTALREMKEESRGVVSPYTSNVHFAGNNHGYHVYTAPVPQVNYQSQFAHTHMHGAAYNEKSKIVSVSAHQVQHAVGVYLTYTT